MPVQVKIVPTSGDYNSTEIIRQKPNCHLIWLNIQYIWLESGGKEVVAKLIWKSQTVIISSGSDTYH